MVKRSETQVPYTSSDLREIADRMDEIFEVLSVPEDLEDDSIYWGVSVEVLLDGITEGELKSHPDGWIGFYPESWD